jgi:arylsulfatase A-like enzyme
MRPFASLLVLALVACSDAQPQAPAGAAAASERLPLRLAAAPAAGEAPELDPALPEAVRALLEAGLTPPITVQLGSESRVAHALRPGRVALARGRAPSDDARVALAFGVLRRPGERAGERREGSGEDAAERAGGKAELGLRVVVRSDGRPAQELRFPLARGGKWSEEALELALPRGADFELALRAESSSGPAPVVALALPVVYTPARAPPTVVLVTSDTHRADHVEGAERAPELRTPALRALAARGLTFDDCYSSSNITVPSHVAMLTGLHPRDAGITDNRTRLSGEPRTLAEAFAAAGWRTVAVTSLNLLSPPHSNVGQGFDTISWTPDQRTAERTVEVALRLLEAAPDRPAFLWVHVFDAHGPYQPPPEYAREVYPSGRDPYDPSLEPPAGARIPPYLEGVRDLEFVRALYRGEIGFLDAQLARLFSEPRVREGVVAVTGDHGEVLGNHDVWWAHKDVYPDTLHVPLIVAWPGAPAGQRSDVPVSNVDVGRTLLDLAGLEGAPFPGRSLVELARGSSREPRFALGGGRRDASINDGRWHLILRLDERDEDDRREGRARHQVELYDLESDPECARDLALVEKAKARELRARLVEWLQGWRGPRFAGARHEDEATTRELAELGYGSAAVDRDAGAPLIEAGCACEWCARFGG